MSEVTSHRRARNWLRTGGDSGDSRIARTHEHNRFAARDGRAKGSTADSNVTKVMFSFFPSNTNGRTTRFAFETRWNTRVRRSEVFPRFSKIKEFPVKFSLEIKPYKMFNQKKKTEAIKRPKKSLSTTGVFRKNSIFRFSVLILKSFCTYKLQWTFYVSLAKNLFVCRCRFHSFGGNTGAS